MGSKPHLGHIFPENHFKTHEFIHVALLVLAESQGQYAELDKMAKSMACTLNAPYMTLSFMALLVIPSLKLSDKGLFNGTKFEFTSLEI